MAVKNVCQDKKGKETDTVILIKKWQSKGCRKSRREAIELNLGLVYSLISRFKSTSITEEDLIQIGSIGLVKAVDGFDVKRNVKFSTYAVPVILGELRSFMRDHKPIKVSRKLTETYKKAKEVQSWLTLKLRREPTITELARELNLSKEEVATAMEAHQEPLSLEASGNLGHDGEKEDRPLTLLDVLTGDGFDHEIHNKLTVQEILGSLDRKRRRLLVLRYFMEKSQKETGEILGLSQVQVSRMENMIIKKLQHKFSEDSY